MWQIQPHRLLEGSPWEAPDKRTRVGGLWKHQLREAVGTWPLTSPASQGSMRPPQGRASSCGMGPPHSISEQGLTLTPISPPGAGGSPGFRSVCGHDAGALLSHPPPPQQNKITTLKGETKNSGEVYHDGKHAILSEIFSLRQQNNALSAPRCRHLPLTGACWCPCVPASPPAPTPVWMALGVKRRPSQACTKPAPLPESSAFPIRQPPLGEWRVGILFVKPLLAKCSPSLR